MFWFLGLEDWGGKGHTIFGRLMGLEMWRVVSGCGGGGWLMFGDAEGCVMFWWWRGFWRACFEAGCPVR